MVMRKWIVFLPSRAGDKRKGPEGILLLRRSRTLQAGGNNLTILFYDSNETMFLSQEYEVAERCVNRVLQMEPNNYQAKQLKDLITKKIRRGA